MRKLECVCSALVDVENQSRKTQLNITKTNRGDLLTATTNYRWRKCAGSQCHKKSVDCNQAWSIMVTYAARSLDSPNRSYTSHRCLQLMGETLKRENTSNKHLFTPRMDYFLLVIKQNSSESHTPARTTVELLFALARHGLSLLCQLFSKRGLERMEFSLPG